jgi:hypothetical protein
MRAAKMNLKKKKKKKKRRKSKKRRMLLKMVTLENLAKNQKRLMKMI